MSRLGSLGGRLYRGEASYEFVGRRRQWLVISAIAILLAIAGLGLRGVEFGLEFRGGAEFKVFQEGATVAQAREATADAGVTDAVVTKATTIDGRESIRVQTPPLSTEEANAVREGLAEELGVDQTEINTQQIGASWGRQITQKALIGIAVFLALIVLYLSMAFEWKMAVGALSALVHDIVLVVGVYAIVGFTVTPATMVGLLTILAYSLYDTVVVFDKVRENTQGLTGGSRMTYSQAANLGVNQTLARSVNTSIVAALPIGGLLFVGAGVLGAGVIKDLALVLFVGVIVGTYSSLCIATPILAGLKEREPAMQALARRVAARQQGVPARAAARASQAPKATRAGRREAGADDTEPTDVIDTVTADEDREPAPAGVAPAGQRSQPRRGRSSGKGGKGKRRPGGKAGGRTGGKKRR